MAQTDSQDRWSQVCLLSLIHDTQISSMNSESEEEYGREGSDEGGPRELVAAPRGHVPATQDNPDLECEPASCKEEEKSESFRSGGVRQKPVGMPGKTTSWERKEAKIQTQDSPEADRVLGALHSGLSRRVMAKGDEGDSIQDTPLDVRSGFLGAEGYLWEQGGADIFSPDKSLKPFPRSWSIPAQVQNQADTGDSRQAEARPPHRSAQGRRVYQKSRELQVLPEHHGAKPYVCQLCGKAYSHRSTLQQHRRLHTGERPYRCSYCGKAYTWSSDHRKHIRTHTGEKPYPCPDCGKAFVRSSDLRKHERNMHSNKKPFPCEQCGLTFNKPLSLLRHQRKHLGPKPFRCSSCNREFAEAGRMEEHQRVHSGERPFSCSTCRKSFTKSSNLYEHQTLHTGLRPFKCPDCGVAFAQPSRLVRHQRIHTGEKPFLCTQCGQTFANSSTLKKHQQTHSGEKDFLCAECGRTFGLASDLAQHIQTHNGERSYQCEDCGRAFTRSNHLQRHRAKRGTCKSELVPSSS